MEKNGGALKLFESLNDWSKIEELINEGESEGLYIECKSPTRPTLDKDKKIKLAQAISGFSNTGGGIIIWGVSTTKHEHSSLDILSQIEEIGNCDNFARQINGIILTLTTPSVTNSKTKTIKKSKKNSRGIIVTYIPKSGGDPIQSNKDNHFYFRNGDGFAILPYEMLKRLFASTESPDLHAVFDSRIVKLERDIWEIPIIITNLSSAVAQYTQVFVQVENEEDCESITVENLKDCSEVNPGKKVFDKEINGVVHRGFDKIVGKLIIKMKVIKRSKRVIKLRIATYADKMRARSEEVSIYLSKQGGISVKKTGENHIY